MKVIHVQFIDRIAGSERFILQISREFKLRGIESQLICVFQPKSQVNISGYLKEFNKNGLKVHCVKTQRKISIHVLNSIRKIISSEKPDLVQTHLIQADFYLALLLLLKLIHCKVISIKHGYNEKFSTAYFGGVKRRDFSVYWLIYRLSYLVLDQTYTISNSYSEFFYEQGITNKKIDVVYHGIRLENLLQTEEFEISNPYICVVGRIEKVKGHIYLLEAFSIIAKKNDSLMLYIVGDGKERLVLEKFCKENNLLERVIFTGFVDNPEKYTRHALVVIIPSLVEPFGLVVLEAQLQKTAVICFDVPALNEILIDKVTGMLVPPYNVDILSETISYLCNNEKFRNEITENAYLRLRKMFSIESMIENTLKQYSKVLNF